MALCSPVFYRIRSFQSINASVIKKVWLVSKSGMNIGVDIWINIVDMKETWCSCLYCVMCSMNIDRSFSFFFFLTVQQHSINHSVIRDSKDKAKKVGDGTRIPVKSEHDIFSLLGLTFRAPHERNA